MGVYIKDFEMPKDCDSCDIPNQIGCTLWIDTDVGHRHPNCPMREVPVPHGRLIDADTLWMDIIHAMDYCDDILEIIEAQPTALEREDE